MTEQPGEHARFDELAAGYALDALDPADEHEFAAHLTTCARCQQALAGYLVVTADMAEAWQAGERARPPARLGDAIMAAAAREAGPTREAAPAPISAMGDGARPGSPALSGAPSRARKPRRSRAGRLAIVGAGLAAVIALIAGGVIAGRLASEHAARPPGTCSNTNACHQIALSAPGSVTTAARVIVRDRTVWLVPTRLRPDDRSRQIYVLWQMTPKRAPIAVGTFDVRAGDRKPVRVGSLRIGYRQTRQFAVSLERGRKAPPAPSHPVAAGTVPS